MRGLLIHGARPAVRAAIKGKKEDAKSKWGFTLVNSCGKNKAAVFLALSKTEYTSAI